MSNEITTYTPEQKSLMLETICKGVKTEDFMFMLELAKKYQLDPFARQIYCTKVGIIISRDGYLAIAHRSGLFDGIKTEFQHDEHGNPIVATTTVWRKDISHPFVESAYWSDYNKGSDVWKQYKHAMLQKVSERMALTKAFCITGLYSDAELDAPMRSQIVDEDCIDVDAVPVEPTPTPAPVKTVQEPVKAEPVKATPAPAQAPAKPKCKIYTKDEVNLKLMPIYQRQKLNLSIFADADLGDGTYNRDMIDEDYRKQQNLVKEQPKAEPVKEAPKKEASSLQEFEAEVIKDATEKVAKSKQTKPSASLSGDTCEKCGAKLLEQDVKISNDFTPGHLFCEKCRLEYVTEKSKAKQN